MLDRKLLPMGVLVLAATSAAAGGCVPRDKYDQTLQDAQSAHAQLTAALEKQRGDEEQLAKLQAQLSELTTQVQQRDDKINDLSTTNHNVQQQFDEATAINAKMRAELERLGKNVDQMLAEKGTLSKALSDTKERLDELRKAQAAAEARAALFQQFVQKFKKMVDAGQLKIVTRNGRLVIQLPNDVLFDSGQTAIKPAGREAIVMVAKVLQSVKGRSFQVAGDTDNVPIQTQRFPSNWELSTARAVEVVRLLVAQGVDPKQLSAAGYGEFDPVADNATPDGRAKNRRIEITLQPNLDELVAAPEIK